MLRLETACKFQIDGQAGGVPLHELSEATIRHTRAQGRKMLGPGGFLEVGKRGMAGTPAQAGARARHVLPDLKRARRTLEDREGNGLRHRVADVLDALAVEPLGSVRVPARDRVQQLLVFVGWRLPCAPATSRCGCPPAAAGSRWQGRIPPRWHCGSIRPARAGTPARDRGTRRHRLSSRSQPAAAVISSGAAGGRCPCCALRAVPPALPGLRGCPAAR